MKPLLILMLSLSLTFTAMGQQYKASQICTTLKGKWYSTSDSSTIKFDTIGKDTSMVFLTIEHLSYSPKIAIQAKFLLIRHDDWHCKMCNSTIGFYLQEISKDGKVTTTTNNGTDVVGTGRSGIDYTINKISNDSITLCGNEICQTLTYVKRKLGQTDRSGVTQKSEAKNLTVNGLKEGKWIEYYNVETKTLNSNPNKITVHIPTADTNAKYYYVGVYKAGKLNGVVKYYENKSNKYMFYHYFIDGKIIAKR